MNSGDFPSTRFARYVLAIANGQEKPKAKSIANSNDSASMVKMYYIISRPVLLDTFREALKAKPAPARDNSAKTRARANKRPKTRLRGFVAEFMQCVSGPVNNGVWTVIGAMADTATYAGINPPLHRQSRSQGKRTTH